MHFGLKNINDNKVKNMSVANLSNAKNSTTIADAEKKIPQTVAISYGAAKTVCGAAENTIVTKVIDGDTVVVEGGYHVRLLGIDADEKGYPCYDQAKTRLEDLILAKQVALEKDKTDVDQYGRCLRYIFVNGKNVDVQLVGEGLAVARFYQPNVKYRSEIAEAEKQAQQNKVGCKWSGAQQEK